MSGSGGEADPVDVMAVLADGRRLLRRARLVAASAALASGGLVAVLGFGSRALLHPADAAEEAVEITGDGGPDGTDDHSTVTTTTSSTTTASSSTTTSSTTSTTGPELVIVPELEGRQQADAEARLEQAGLAVGDVLEEHSTETLLGAVLRTEPPGGTEVPAGSSVALVVSLGPEDVIVPDVEGLVEDQAEARLEQTGLAVGDVLVECSAEHSRGIAVRTEPPAGTQVSRGTQTTLVVSGLPPTGCVD